MNCLTLTDILQIYAQRGQQLYGGEAVTQLAHALQCATLAVTAHQPKVVIAACLLHDLGHLLPAGDLSADRATEGRRGMPHEERAAFALRPLFGAAVTEPIRLHVQAKRYLCAVDATYWETLSPASQQSLVQQGGIFSPRAAQVFIAQPHAAAAVQLRRWDDQAKVVGLSTPDLNAFSPVLAEVCLQSSLET